MRRFVLAAGVAWMTSAAATGGVGAAGGGMHLNGPPPGHTGGFGEPTCQICHEGDPLNAFGGSVRIRGLPEEWRPGATHVLTVELEAAETGAAGFQLAARFAEGSLRGQPAGRLTAVSPRVAVTVGETGQPYAHHSPDGTRPPDDTGSSWLVEWTAPDLGGAIQFNVAANSGNGDNSPLLDLVYVAEVTVPAAIPSTAPRPSTSPDSRRLDGDAPQDRSRPGR